MKYYEAKKIINKGLSSGFMVSFEWVKGSMLHSDHFPDKHADEKLIETEEEAWVLARKFAANTVGNCVNIYVSKGNFIPVDGYKLRYIKNR
jgi:hypothetical protein